MKIYPKCSTPQIGFRFRNEFLEQTYIIVKDYGDKWGIKCYEDSDYIDYMVRKIALLEKLNPKNKIIYVV